MSVGVSSTAAVSPSLNVPSAPLPGFLRSVVASSAAASSPRLSVASVPLPGFLRSVVAIRSLLR